MQQQVQAYEQVNAPRVTMQDAIRNVSALSDLLPNVIDDVESIEAASIPVQYQLQWDTNFEDRNAYLTGVARYIEEAHVHAAMVCNYFVSTCVGFALSINRMYRYTFIL